jgi:hypothetical protein
MSDEHELDLNTAGKQKSFDVIPENTVVTLQMTVRPGGVGLGGFLTRAATAKGDSEGLDCEFTVVDGQYAKRKLWQRFTMHGTTPKHAEAGEISRNTLRAIVESARGVRPDDKSETANAARKLASYGALDGLRFVARLGVEPPKDGYKAKNTVLEVITPDKQAWQKPEQIQSAATATPAATTPPANAVTRPQWAE